MVDSTTLQTNESIRLTILSETKLLFSDHNDPDYDRYTSLTSRILHVPICSVSLVDSHKVWYKSKIGVKNDSEPREKSFANFTILPESPDVFVIEDTFSNSVFMNISKSNGQPYIRFYAGAALIVEGVKIGSLCISDYSPRSEFKLEHRMNFMDFAAAISTLISERRRSLNNNDLLDNMRILLSIERQKSLSKHSSIEKNLKNYSNSNENDFKYNNESPNKVLENISPSSFTKIGIGSFRQSEQNFGRSYEKNYDQTYDRKKSQSYKEFHDFESLVDHNHNYEHINSDSFEKLIDNNESMGRNTDREQISHHDSFYRQNKEYGQLNGLNNDSSSQSLYLQFVEPSKNEIENDENRNLFNEMGHGVRCNIFKIIDQTKAAIISTSKKIKVTWLLDRSSLDLGQHICHPDIISYLLTTTVTYFASKWSHVLILIGFKKNLSNRNHKRSLHINQNTPGIIDGRLNVQVCIKLPATSLKKYLKKIKSFHVPSQPMPKKATAEESDDSVPSDDSLRSRKLNKSKFDILDEIIREIGGSSRVSDLYEVIDDESSSASVIKVPDVKLKVKLKIPHLLFPLVNQQINDVKNVSSNNNLKSDTSSKGTGGTGSLSNVSTTSSKGLISDQSIVAERVYDYCIPCIIAIPTKEMLKVAEKTHMKISDIEVEKLTKQDSNDDSLSYAFKYPSQFNYDLKESKIVVIITFQENSKDDSHKSVPVKEDNKNVKDDNSANNDNNDFDSDDDDAASKADSKKSSHDENYNYNLIKLLRSQGYEVTVTNIAEEGIELLKWTKFDVAFVDITMKTIGDMSVLQVYSLWLQEPTQLDVVHVNIDTLIIGIAGPSNNSSPTSQQQSNAPSQSQSTLNSPVANNNIPKSPSLNNIILSSKSITIIPKSFVSNLKSKYQNRANMNPVSISTISSSNKQNVNRILDNILPNVNMELLQFNGFSYGMHFYISNPTVYIMTVRRRFKKIEDVIRILDAKIIENNSDNSAYTSELGSYYNISTINSENITVIDDDNDDIMDIRSHIKSSI